MVDPVVPERSPILPAREWLRAHLIERVLRRPQSPAEIAPMAAGTPVTLHPNPLNKWLRSHLVERSARRLPRTRDVLDLCCGYGFYFTINPNARAVEGNPECVEYLRRQGRDVLLCNVLESLPFADSEFSWVLAHDVCEHFSYPQLQRIFAEVHRILRPGGAFLVIVPNRKGYEWGIRAGAGHVLFVTEREVAGLSEGRFEVREQYPEPLPRWMGRFFTHNKEVFKLVKP
jgi:SAM-dependent methyltransferase